MTPTIRIRVPETARPGEVVTIRTVITHPMESGQRRDADGTIFPRKIINAFSCSFDGAPVLDIALDTAVAANPYFEFKVRVIESGSFTFRWTDDDGTVFTEERPIRVG